VRFNLSCPGSRPNTNGYKYENDIGYKYSIISEYKVNIECGYGYRYGIVLDTNTDIGMGTDTRYGMLFVPYCLSITLVLKITRGGEL